MGDAERNREPTLLVPLAWASGVAASLLLVVSHQSDALVEHTLLGHAQSSASTWRTQFTETVPDLERLVRTGKATDEQRRLIAASKAGSDIFRFELFDSDGTRMYLSDQASFADDSLGGFNQTALETARTGRQIVTVEDGRDDPGRPDWYVEAYLPVQAADDGTSWVVEVYVDVTGLALALRSRFNWLSLMLLGATAVIYIVPTLLLIQRNNQLRARDRQLLRISRRDPLTGLLNRAAFSEASSGLFAARSENGASLGVMFIDLDEFKSINDTLGHEAGDQLLTHVGKLLTTACRSDDLVARLGGDEFVVLCPGVTAKGLTEIGDRLIELGQRPLVSGDMLVNPRFSIGLHLSPPGETEGQALSRADLAVYRAKANGRGRAVMFSAEFEEQDRQRARIAELVRSGISEGLFLLEFQPIFDRALELSGFEALLRLRVRDGALIPPEDLIPIAEDLGLIEDIGLWALENAISTAARWTGGTSISVNLSAHAFRSRKLAPTIDQAIAKSGIDPSRICLETPEATLADPGVMTAQQLVDLKSSGARIAIDDFGKAYSSLGNLWQHSVDQINIDKSLLEGFEFDPDRYARLIDALTTLGHRLDLTVKAEGIERQSQLDALRDAGCDLFQGFLFSGPMSAEAAAKFAAQAGVGRIGSADGSLIGPRAGDDSSRQGGHSA